MSKNKTIYQLNALEFEKYCVELHQKNNPNHLAIHWSNVSEEMLFECGFIKNFYNQRRFRKHIREQGKKYT